MEDWVFLCRLPNIKIAWINSWVLWWFVNIVPKVSWQTWMNLLSHSSWIEKKHKTRDPSSTKILLNSMPPSTLTFSKSKVNTSKKGVADDAKKPPKNKQTKRNRFSTYQELCTPSIYNMASQHSLLRIFSEFFYCLFKRFIWHHVSRRQYCNSFQCSSTKTSYVALLRLAPYFHELSLSKVSNVPYYTVSFDGFINVSVQKGQMALAISFWGK